MQLKLFTVPIKNLAVPEGEMNAFLRGHRVLAVRKEFIADGENSYWTFCVEYMEGPAGAAGLPDRPKVDYREELTPEEFQVFSRLRDWRKGVAEKEKIPVYTVLTNGQLAEVVRRKVQTKAALKEIPGVGEARVEKYGEGLLGMLLGGTSA